MASAFLGLSSFPEAVALNKSKEREVEVLRSKNVQLKQVAEESQKHQAHLQAELEKMRMRLLKTEEAEESLCSQLGELEADSVLQARNYNHQITSLKHQLAQMQALLAAAQEQLKSPN
ncbi:hypothetical protein SUGI_0059560 [Cryptomeria japonica]|nr:hypothetical protein SUGI_0059560 [Cryptomeria japonica]